MSPHSIIESQFHAALAMLRAAIETCPDDLWYDASYPNPFWRVAYHALFYAQLYLSRSEEDFRRYITELDDAHFMDEPLAEGVNPPARRRMLEYATHVAGAIAPGLAARPDDDESGFDWIRLSRIELHMYNIRHVQHHAGQLSDRLRNENGGGIEWIGRRRA